MKHGKKLCALAVLLLAPLLGHAAVLTCTRIQAPQLSGMSGEPEARADGTRVMASPGGSAEAAYARRRGKVLEVRLAGGPERVGHQHGRLLYQEMVDDEGDLYRQFSHHVPFAPARWLIMDLARVKFRDVDRNMGQDRRREIGAQAEAFAPDPFESFLPTYHRFVFLQSLYDIALSFERSPLIGCTSFTVSGERGPDGHAVLARNFDFEAGPIFDLGKAVFLVREEGKIPYASVAWPGLVGAVTGMNLEGVAVVVHGARATAPRTTGTPVVHALRDLLGRARTTEEALAVLTESEPMVSHMVLVLDAHGDAAVAERAPGAATHVRRGGPALGLTNHLEGPLAADPKNRTVEGSTSTLPRRQRLDELLANLRPGPSVQDLVAVLRDKQGAGGQPLPLGDRRAIDALIATHAVVMDATARELWVSEGPHLVGRFVRFDLTRLLGPEPALADDPPVFLDEDPIAKDGRYDAWVRDGSRHGFVEGGGDGR